MTATVRMLCPSCGKKQKGESFAYDGMIHTGYFNCEKCKIRIDYRMTTKSVLCLCVEPKTGKSESWTHKFSISKLKLTAKKGKTSGANRK